MCNLLKDFAAKVDGKLQQCETIIDFIFSHYFCASQHTFQVMIKLTPHSIPHFQLQLIIL